MSFHFFHINEVYSDNTGRVQYIEFVGDADGQHQWALHQLLSTDGVNDNTYDFLTNLPSNLTNGKSVLVATQGYKDLGLAMPDYVIPDESFLFLDGSVIFPDMDELAYTNLPNDGITAINGAGTEVANSPLNFAGVNGTIPGTPILGGAFIDTLTGTAGNDFMVGLGGNDKLTGGAGNDTIKGGANNDNLNGGIGTDRLLGEAGNDILIWGAPDTFNGGVGTDTLRLLAGNLNLTQVVNTKIADIETFNMTAGGNNTLTLNINDVLAFSSTTNTLTVLGNAGDTVNLVGAFTLFSTVGNFETWKNGSALVRVELELNVI